MFNDVILEKIFSDPEVQQIPIGAQSTMIGVIAKILEEMGVDVNAATFYQSELF